MSKSRPIQTNGRSESWNAIINQLAVYYARNQEFSIPSLEYDLEFRFPQPTIRNAVLVLEKTGAVTKTGWDGRRRLIRVNFITTESITEVRTRCIYGRKFTPLDVLETRKKLGGD